jgi:hypothetical protein
MINASIIVSLQLHFLLMRQLPVILLAITLALILVSWGGAGHRKINEGCTLSFPAEMSSYLLWTDSLGDHASDADYRKEYDPSESRKHYINIDTYPEFLTTGKIPATFDSVIAIYGVYFVNDKGLLPWATTAAFDTLQNTFYRRDWHKAILTASDLGHYIGDGHMPLHLTKNYDGQYTGNNGIHTRYETYMLNYFVNNIVIQPASLDYVSYPEAYIMNYIYDNYKYTDSIMQADNEAEALAGNHTSYNYFLQLWNRTGDFTEDLMDNAAHALASMIYTAWYNAGKPVYDPFSRINNVITEDGFRASAFITSKSNLQIIAENVHKDFKVEIYDLQGKLLFDRQYKPVNKNTFTLNIMLKQESSDMFFIRLRSAQQEMILKLTGVR